MKKKGDIRSYQDFVNKKLARDIAFKRMKGKKLIGLAGPDLEEYLDYFHNKGIKDVSVYEKDLNTYISDHLPHISRGDFDYQYGDIFKAPVEKGVIYDLDFMVNIQSVEKHIRKFKDNAVITVTQRPLRFESNIYLFAQYKGEMIKYFKMEYPHLTKENDLGDRINRGILATDKQTYGIILYRDMSNMIMIYPDNSLTLNNFNY